MEKKIAYICAPLKPDKEHTFFEHRQRALFYAKEATKKGYIAFIPHFAFYDATEADREEILQFELDILNRFDLIYVFGDFISSGMVDEIWNAECSEIRILWDNQYLESEYERMKND